MQQSPYYQCGLAILNQQSKSVQCMKFTSKGHIAGQTQDDSAQGMTKVKEEVKNEEDKKQEAIENLFAATKEEKKQSGVSGTSKEEGESDEDEEAKKEQLAQRDYGYRERAIVLPEDDCFFKMENALQAGVS